MCYLSAANGENAEMGDSRMDGQLAACRKMLGAECNGSRIFGSSLISGTSWMAGVCLKGGMSIDLISRALTE